MTILSKAGNKAKQRSQSDVFREKLSLDALSEVVHHQYSHERKLSQNNRPKIEIKITCAFGLFRWKRFCNIQTASFLYHRHMDVPNNKI